jgi:hypothetical protein
MSLVRRTGAYPRSITANASASSWWRRARAPVARAARYTAVLLGWLIVPPPAAAQRLPRIDPGVPVRLVVQTAAGPRSLSGSLLLLGLDSVSIVPPGALFPVSFDLQTLERFELNRGKPPGLMYGAPLYGLALGTLFGATALRPAAKCRVLPDADGCSWETSQVVVGAAGGAILLGTMVRLLVPDRWQEIPLHALGVDRTGLGPPHLQLRGRVRF